VTRTFKRHAKRLGFVMRFHDLRASHLTILLDKGEPVHVVAARAGHDPVTLLRNYAKWTKKADAKVAETIANISKGMATAWVQVGSKRLLSSHCVLKQYRLSV
jgi:integrase